MQDGAQAPCVPVFETLEALSHTVHRSIAQTLPHGNHNESTAPERPDTLPDTSSGTFKSRGIDSGRTKLSPTLGPSSQAWQNHSANSGLPENSVIRFTKTAQQTSITA